MFLQKYKYLFVLVIIFMLSFLITYLFIGNANNFTQVKFEKEVYNIGTVEFSSATDIKIKYINTGDYPLKLKDVKPSCGCTLVNWNVKSIAPKQKDSILVTFNAENTGFFLKRVYVFLNVERSPRVIFIEGVVK